MLFVTMSSSTQPGRADCQQVISDEFPNLDYNDGCAPVSVRGYRGKYLLWGCLIERHTGRTFISNIITLALWYWI